jgi:FixJ family two-component response regulator
MLRDRSMESRRQPNSIVYVIDDETSVRDSLSNLFRSVDQSVETFDLPSSFLQREHLQIPSCIILDIRMPGSSGLEFQSTLTKSDIKIPIIFFDRIRRRGNDGSSHEGGGGRLPDKALS